MTADTWQQFELDSRLRSTRYLLRHGSEHCLSVGGLHAVVTGSGILCVASAGCAVFAACQGVRLRSRVLITAESTHPRSSRGSKSLYHRSV